MKTLLGSTWQQYSVFVSTLALGALAGCGPVSGSTEVDPVVVVVTVPPIE